MILPFDDEDGEGVTADFIKSTSVPPAICAPIAAKLTNRSIAPTGMRRYRGENWGVDGTLIDASLTDDEEDDDGGDDDDSEGMDGNDDNDGDTDGLFSLLAELFVTDGDDDDEPCVAADLIDCSGATGVTGMVDTRTLGSVATVAVTVALTGLELGVLLLLLLLMIW
jgi:hypothetical protein